MAVFLTYEEKYPASLFIINGTKARITCKRCGIFEEIWRATLHKRIERKSPTTFYCSECRRIERLNRES